MRAYEESEFNPRAAPVADTLETLGSSSLLVRYRTSPTDPCYIMLMPRQL